MRLALRAGAHTTIAGEGTAISTTRAWRLSEAPAGAVTAKASISNGTVALLVAFLFAVPVGALALFGIAMGIARRETIPVARRRKIFRALVIKGTFALLALHTPLAMYVITSSMLRGVGDLWFGTTSVSWAMLSLLLIVLVPVTAAPKLNRYEERLFGPAPGGIAPATEFGLPPKPVVDPAEKKAMLRSATAAARLLSVLLFVILVGAPLVSILFPKFQAIKIPIAICLMVAFGVLLRRTGRIGQTLLDPAYLSVDPALSAEAASLASTIGVSAPEVVVSDMPATADVAAVVYYPRLRRLVVNRRAIEILTSAELRWVMAESLVGHRPGGSLSQPYRVVGLVGLALVSIGLLLATTIGRLPTLAILSVAIGLVLLAGVAMGPFIRSLLLADDRLSLQLTGDLEAAECAIRKLWADGTNRPTTPELEKRIAGWARV